MRQEARAELAQNSVVEAGVGQLQAHQVFPVDPGTDRIGSLPVGQPFHELQQRCECEADRHLGGLFPGRKQGGEVAILDHHMQVVIETHHRIAVGKDRPRHQRGLVWHIVCALRVQRHDPPLV